jgi:hypothetical protein
MTLAAQIADPATPLNEYGALRRVMICPAEAAYGDQGHLDAVWQGEEFLGRPDFAEAAPGGVILGRMRNAYRAPEPAALGAYYEARGIPLLGAIEGSGLLEGGDFVWFDRTTCAVAEGYRTNAEGIRQLREILGPEIEVLAVPLPHDQGPGACLHLMSLISPLLAADAGALPRLAAGARHRIGRGAGRGIRADHGL